MATNEPAFGPRKRINHGDNQLTAAGYPLRAEAAY
jgi:hypothetical protein